MKYLGFLFLLFNLGCQTQRSVDLKPSSQPTSEIPDKRIFALNHSVKPCQNFHQYVCSSVESNFKLRDDRSSHTFAFDDSSERLLEKKKEFFLNIDQEKGLSKRSLQMKSYYKACMNEKSSSEEEIKLVNKLKQQIENVKTIQDYLDLNIKNLANSEWTFIDYGINPNVDNPLKYDIMFDLDFMFLPEHSYYENPELIQAYQDLITDFFVTIYPDSQRSEMQKRAKAIVDFEIRFKQIYPMPEEFRKRYTERRYVSRKDYFKKTAPVGLEDFFKKYIPPTTLIRDFTPESFIFAKKELVAENLQMLKDLYIFRSARTYMDDAYPDLYKKRMEFSHKYLGGPLTRPDRQERCTSAVMSAFNKELDQELIRRVFKNFPNEKMEEVVKKIRLSILKGIENNAWLSAESKKGALEKIEKAELQIIQPKTAEEWDFKPIQEYSDKYPYENAKRLALLSHKRTMEKLRKGVNQKAWGMGPLTVNAYYDPTKNKFVMPMGILQYPFFDTEGDVIENLGAVGSVVGHELGHSIDDEGSKFNASGKLKQWMSEADIEKFKARGQRMIEQFNKIGHNGSLTLGENVADLVGLTFAYQAAFPENKGTLEDKRRFFVAHARVWCGVMREKAKEMQLKTDPHSMGYARINEQMKHQDGFQEAYSCQKGDALYTTPEQRIKIW